MTAMATQNATGLLTLADPGRKMATYSVASITCEKTKAGLKSSLSFMGVLLIHVEREKLDQFLAQLAEAGDFSQRRRVAVPLQIHLDGVGYLAGAHEEYAVGEQDSLVYVVRDEHHRLAPLPRPHNSSSIC